MIGAFNEWQTEKSINDMRDSVQNRSKTLEEQDSLVGIDLYNRIYNENILMMYKGAVTFDLVNSVVEVLDRKVALMDDSVAVRKLFYSAIVEVAQNLYYHMDEIKNDIQNCDAYDAKSGMITVIAKDDYYSILTGNFIPTAKTYRLKEKIDEVNSADKTELRAMYKETLSNGQFSDKGTAGLGMIQLARKTGESLNYNFEKVNNEFSYFTFHIKIDRTT